MAVGLILWVVVAFGAAACPYDDDHLVLENLTIAGAETFQACQTLTAGAGVTVSATGAATFQAGQRVALQPGFRVQAGGRLQVRVGETLLLTVTKTGTGSGTVTSSPAGINCGSACAAVFAAGTPVTLTATPDDGSIFGGWSGDCGGALCQVTMSQDRNVTATFAADSPTVQAPVNITLPPDQIQNLQLVTLVEEGVNASTSTSITVPADTASLVFLTNSADNIAGIGISQGDGSGVAIDATSTAIGLVMMVPSGLSDLPLTTAELEARIRTVATFDTLVALVASKQQIDPAGIIDDEQIIEAVIQVVIEVEQVVAPMSALMAPHAAVANDQPQWPWLEWLGNRHSLRNPRFVPYGLGIINDAIGPQPIQWLRFIDEREYSWQLNWIPIGPNEPTSVLLPELNNGKLCAIRFDPIANYFETVMTVLPDGVAVASWVQLRETLNELPPDVRLYREAELNGMIAWHMSAVLNAIKSVPGKGAIAAGLVEDIVRDLVQNNGDVVAVPRLSWSELGGVALKLLLQYAYDSREKANSILRTIAKIAFNDGRKIRALGIATKLAAKILSVPQYVTNLRFVGDTLVAPRYACYRIEGANFYPFNPLNPSPSGTGRLNDTGITWCANDTTNFLPCPVAGYPWQDAQDGRDVTHNDDSDGHAGFSFTKLDGNGNPLAASATSWRCVRDNVTGLIWEVKTDDGGLRDKDNTYTWYNPDSSSNGGNAGVQNGGNCTGSACDTHGFVQAVNAQGLCGAKDWRLPTRFELESITSNHRAKPAIDTAFFPNTPSSWFWSSSSHANYPSRAWYVNFDNGYVDDYRKAYAGYVRLVRGGQ